MRTLDNITELAELFVERDNKNDKTVFVADYLEGGKIRVRDNIVLQPGGYINAIPQYSCNHAECSIKGNIKAGDKVIILRNGKQWITIAKVRS